MTNIFNIKCYKKVTTLKLPKNYPYITISDLSNSWGAKIDDWMTQVDMSIVKDQGSRVKGQKSWFKSQGSRVKSQGSTQTCLGLTAVQCKPEVSNSALLELQQIITNRLIPYFPSFLIFIYNFA